MIVAIGLFAVAVILLIVGVWSFSSRKKDAGAISTIVSIALFAILGGAWLVAPASIGLEPAEPSEEKPAEPSEGVIPSEKTSTIEDLSIKLQEKNSGSWEAADGNMYFYQYENGEIPDPKDAATDPFVTIPIIDGDGNSTSGLLQTNTKYFVVISDAGRYYPLVYKEFIFSNTGFSEFTGKYTYTVPDPIAKIASFVTFANLQDSSSLAGDTNSVGNDLNELRRSGTTLVYDESDGDATYIVRVTVGATGAHAELHDVVLCVEYESSSAQPEGNEVDTITVQRYSGSEIPSITNFSEAYFNAESCLLLGDLKAGTSGTYDLTFTVDEDSLDTADDFKLVIDDLEDNGGQDILNDRGASQDSLDFDAQA